MTASEKETLANLLPNAQVSSSFIVSRGQLPQELFTDIQTANSVKLLVAGQRGMGKTVELRRLESLLLDSDNYLPVFLQFGAEESIEDVRLVYTMAQALISKGHFTPKKGSSLARWFEKEEIISSYSESIGGESGINANAYFVKAAGGIKSSRDKKITKTSTVVKQKKDLIAAFNELIQEFIKTAKKHPVFIVDDIDKIQNLSSIEATFIHSAQLLGNIDAPCVFTVPFTYATSSFIRMASLPYENIHRVPAVAVLSQNGSVNSSERDLLISLLRKRIKVDFFDADDLARIVEYSGGVIVDALRLARGVAKQRILHPASAIEELIESEFQKIADEYIYQLDKPILWQKVQKYCQTNDSTLFLTDDATVDLVCKMIVIEYREKTTWHRVHPAVKRLYEQNKDHVDQLTAPVK